MSTKFNDRKKQLLLDYLHSFKGPIISISSRSTGSLSICRLVNGAGLGILPFPTFGKCYNF